MENVFSVSQIGPEIKINVISFMVLKLRLLFVSLSSRNSKNNPFRVPWNSDACLCVSERHFHEFNARINDSQSWIKFEHSWCGWVCKFLVPYNKGRANNVVDWLDTQITSFWLEFAHSFRTYYRIFGLASPPREQRNFFVFSLKRYRESFGRSH